MKRFSVIRCPHCGREYLPEEIFLPGEFFGQPRNIVRNNGKIIYFDGKSLNTSETYNCDECGKDFKVEAYITFNTDADDMFDDFQTSIYDTVVHLDEEDEDEKATDSSVVASLW